jgi:hypothetical protein
LGLIEVLEFNDPKTPQEVAKKSVARQAILVVLDFIVFVFMDE